MHLAQRKLRVIVCASEFAYTSIDILFPPIIHLFVKICMKILYCYCFQFINVTSERRISFRLLFFPKIKYISERYKFMCPFHSVPTLVHLVGFNAETCV